MKTIYANIWGGQQKVHLGTWAEIRKRGFHPNDRAFEQKYKPFHRWYVTTETYDEICQKEEWYQTLDTLRKTGLSPIVYS